MHDIPAKIGYGSCPPTAPMSTHRPYISCRSGRLTLGLSGHVAMAGQRRGRGMTWEPCEGKEAGPLSFVQQDPQWLHQSAVIGPFANRTGDPGPAGMGAKVGSSKNSAWLTTPRWAVTWLRSRANGLQHAGVGIASVRSARGRTPHSRPTGGTTDGGTVGRSEAVNSLSSNRRERARCRLGSASRDNASSPPAGWGAVAGCGTPVFP